MNRFFEWIGLKEKLHRSDHKPPFVSERDLWWASLGQNVGSGSTSAVGLTTAQLQASLPAGFDPSVWAAGGSVNNGYPYLKWQTATPVVSNPVILTGSAPAAIVLYYVAKPQSDIYGSATPSLTGSITDQSGKHPLRAARKGRLGENDGNHMR